MTVGEDDEEVQLVVTSGVIAVNYEKEKDEKWIEIQPVMDGDTIGWCPV